MEDATAASSAIPALVPVFLLRVWLSGRLVLLTGSTGTMVSDGSHILDEASSDLNADAQ
jgi:hypothetical protein